MQKQNPGANAATGALAHIYTERGEHAKAVKMYELLAKAEPDNAELKAKLAAAQEASKEGADKQK
jgi:Tfp pilus assembly protein PilF